MAQSGLFTSQLAALESASPVAPALVASLHCSCSACAQASGQALSEGAGHAAPGQYATTPNDNSYAFSAPSAPQVAGGSTASLMAGSKWSSQDATSAKTVITYSFASPATSVFSQVYSAGWFQSTAREFSSDDKDLTRAVLEKIAAVCNVEFVEVADNASECGVLRYAYSTQPNAMGYTGYAFFPSASALGGDIWIGANQAGSEWDFYRPNLILHETLHAMGLKHPFDGAETLSAEQNIIPNTVMSYSPIAGASSGMLSRYPGEPMPLDIAALQALYGAATHNESNTTYDLASGEFQGGFRALWDSAGIDTLDASNVANAVNLDLNEAAKSDVGMTVFAFAYSGGRATSSTVYSTTLSIAQGTVIENATGSGYADTLRGNSADNVLSGGAGDDRLEGGGGNDRLTGGEGLDTAVYALDRASFRITRAGDHYIVADLAGRAGTDTVTGVERLSFNNAQVAIDLDGNAGTAAKLLSAVAGIGSLANTTTVGRMLAVLDGGASELDAAQQLCDALVGQPLSSSAFVAHVFHNVTGQYANPSEMAYYKGLLDSGHATQASLAVMAAESSANVAHIDLAGLAQSGLLYTPFAA